MGIDYKTYIELALSVVFILVGGLGLGWFKIVKETNKLLKEQNIELKIANKELLDKHTENVKQLSSLQAQINMMQTIPLASIDSTLKEIIKGNDRIVGILEVSAKVLARDTENAASAARKVKADLIKSNQ